MQSNSYWTYPLLLAGLLFGLSGSIQADTSDDMKTRGPAGTVDIAPKPGTAGPLPVSVAPTPKPLNFKVNYVYRPKGKGDLKPLVEGSVLHSGDHYKIQFTPAEDSYVYIFQVDSAQAIYRLFPMKAFGGVQVNNFNPVKGGKTVHLPADDKSFQLDQQTGPESIIFLAFRQPNAQLEQQYEDLVKARLNKNSGEADALQVAMKKGFKTRGLAGIVDDPGQQTTDVAWTPTESFTVPVQRLNNLCADCVSLITFEHR
ncbi:MAG: DUF4384 domain-containing protein [Candidatus Competibacteraceae bacterium]|nr:DUF4384 domain-containing protein [Candidatus Competibacteraceae bacterium]